MSDQEYADWVSKQRCSQCNEPFTIDEWDDRHTDYEGGDCHAKCCPECNNKKWLRMQAKLTKKVRERQATGNLLTVREATRLLRTNIDTVLDLAADEGLNVNVGFRTGSGYATEKHRGDWTLEDLNEWEGRP